EREGLARSRDLFRFGATPYYVDLMDPRDPRCPIRMQAIPSPHELDIRDEQLADPLGDAARSPPAATGRKHPHRVALLVAHACALTPAIVHKYPRRVLLLVVDRCAIHCRHCNRRRLVGGDRPTRRDELEAAFEYIERTPRIRDVLISGGDPLLLSTARLDAI